MGHSRTKNVPKWGLFEGIVCSLDEIVSQKLGVFYGQMLECTRQNLLQVSRENSVTSGRVTNDIVQFESEMECP